MYVNGRECSIVIKTDIGEADIPYSYESVREAVSLIEEEISVEGSGMRRACRKRGGAEGCVITPLTFHSAPLLLCLVMGALGKPLYVSDTKNVYQYRLNLLPMEDAAYFDLVQNRSNKGDKAARRLYERCRVKGFELRVMRDEAVKLKIDICGEKAPVEYHCIDEEENEAGERFYGDRVFYNINGKEYKNIYGVTLSVNKTDGVRAELLIKRALENGGDLPQNIEEMSMTALLLKDKHLRRRFGIFKVTLKRLVLISDETAVEAADSVIGPLRYYAAGPIQTELHSSEDSLL